MEREDTFVAGTRRHGARSCALVASLLIASCGTTLTARHGLHASADGVEVRAVSIVRNAAHDLLVIDVHNDSGDDVAVHPGRASLRSGYAPSASAREPSPGADVAVGVGNAVVEGARVGGAVTGSEPGALAGGAAGLLVALPIAAVIVAVDQASRPPALLVPGSSARYALTFDARLDQAPYSLDVRGMLGLDAPALAAVPIVEPGDPHLGYAAPETSPWVFALGLRAGYVGILTGTQAQDGNFGIDVGIGLRMGDLVEAFVVLTPLFPQAGLDIRFHPRVSADLDVVPFVGYGYEYQPFSGTSFHRTYMGVELMFLAVTNEAFGWAVPSAEVGVFAEAGPVFVDARSIGVLAEGGVRFHAHL